MLESMTTSKARSTMMTVTTSPRSPPPVSSHSGAVYRSLSPNQQDLALSFFLTYVTDLGRGHQSSRGFVELVRPVLQTERHDSALFAAVHAVATKIWVRLEFSLDNRSQQPMQLFSQAIERLQKAVSDTKDRERDATVLAALMLELYDTYSAVFDQKRPLGTHLDGAWALLLQRNGNAVRSRFHGKIISHLLHSKVSMCIRERKAFNTHEIEWLKKEAIPVLPNTPSSLLDIVGVSVANLQSAYAAKKTDISSLPLEEWFRRVRLVEAQLEKWLEVIPQHWYPVRVNVGKGIESAVIAYQDTCDIYPNIQIASLWNVWRIYRLILLEINLQLAKTSIIGDNNTLGRAMDSTQRVREAQELLDSISYSVPFYLGNRVGPATLSDMGTPQCIFPSYHDLISSHREAFLQYQCSDSYMSEIDHSRHAILQGPWRIMNILAYLEGLLAEEDSLVGPQLLKAEQKDWILGQFFRSLYVQRLVPTCPLPKMTYQRDESHPRQIPFKALHAEHLASKVRDGLWIMNIL